MFAHHLSGTSAVAFVVVTAALVWTHGWFVGRRRRGAAASGRGALEQPTPVELREVAVALDSIRAQVRDLDRQRSGTDAELLARVRDIEQSTQVLGTALRSPRTRGRWGELHLRRAVELAGLSEHCDFVEQRTHAHADAAARLRPDMIVHLPGGRAVVIDAKAPMEAWLEAVDTTDADARAVLEQRHAACVREHVRSLAGRDYARNVPGSSPVVVLYLPGEDLLRAALDHDAQLLEYAARHDIALATPISLITILRGVAMGWQETRLADNAAQIAALGGRLYERIGVVNDHLAKLGRALDASVRAFDDTVGSIHTRLIPAARGLRELDATGTRPELHAVPPIARLPRTQEQR
jgi:DNA recombination protein RmuC